MYIVIPIPEEIPQSQAQDIVTDVLHYTNLLLNVEHEINSTVAILEEGQYEQPTQER